MRRKEGGFALPGALLALLLLSVALALVAASLQLRMRLVLRESRSLTLTALSDAALAEALARLSEDRSFRGSPAHAFGVGRLESEVYPLSDIQFTIRAEAFYAGRERVVEADVVRPPDQTARVVRWRVIAEK